MTPSSPSRTETSCLGREPLATLDVSQRRAVEIETVASHLASSEECDELDFRLHDPESEARVVAEVQRALVLTAPVLGSDYARMEAQARALVGPATTAASAVETLDSPGGPAAEVPASRLVGLYELLSEIGRGGMGIVYKARHVHLGQVVALKMIKGGHHAGKEAVTRFVREARAVDRLKHPNVVHVREFSEHEGLLYFAMDWVEGGNLQARLDAGPMPPREAAELVRTLAHAVGFAHRAGVIHRDLKPANILLTPDGTPKIADFGLAKLIDAERDGTVSSGLTRTHVVLGTPHYMAPEQAKGESSQATKATDVYALGAILYACLTGRPPFEGKMGADILKQVRTAAPDPPSRHQLGLSSWLEAICLKCLEKSPSRRYPSAEALAEDLDRWLHNQRPQGIHRLAWLRRPLRGLAAALFVNVGFLAALAIRDFQNPDQALRRIQSGLRRGDPVTLMAATGYPHWYCWRAGELYSQAYLARDRAFTIQTSSVALLELLHDPIVKSYRISAEVRHDTGDGTGHVGLYFNHRTYPGRRPPFQFFFQVTFNAVSGEPELRERLAAFDFPPRAQVSARQQPGSTLERMLKGPLHPNAVVCDSCLLLDEPPHLLSRLDRRFTVANGPTFRPWGEHNGLWHHLVLDVTPQGVTFWWNGQGPFSCSAEDAERNVVEELKIAPLLPDRTPRDFRPTFVGGRGLGLIVQRGSASFRAVTVTPLGNTQP